MEQLIPVINRLQDVFAVVESTPLDLPQIVVVGSQSSGKSSVLESIVGRDFLPRGAGIVTRRPLVLQLFHKASQGSGPKEWGEFLHQVRHDVYCTDLQPGKKYVDFDQIRQEIENETNRVTGTNKGISPLAINLRIYSPSVLNLTLVDLPGLTKVPVGDQPRNISQQILDMVLQYITKPNSIILAVSPANVDLANSDALKLAREVDPDGMRTIGVLTKLDLMDKGTDCLDILQQRVYQLRLGFVGVVNRSQQDIVTRKSVALAREQENEFFQSHPLYKQIAGQCGIQYLTKTLNKILMHHIRDCLPDLRMRVNSMLSQTRQEIAALGDPRLNKSKGALLLHIINAFVHDYNATIDGQLNGEQATEELYGGARINYIFNDIFGNYVDSIDAIGGLTEEVIQTTMTNARGTRASLFIPEESFTQLAQRQVKILEEPALRCVDLVYDELQRIVNCIEINELRRFDNLRENIVRVVNDLLRRCKTPCQDMITSLVELEIAHINTSHPDFIGGGDAIEKILKRRAQRQLQRQEQEQRVVQKTDDLPPELQGKYQQELNKQSKSRDRERREREKEAQLERELQLQREQKQLEQQQREAQREQEQSKSGFWGIFGGGSGKKNEQSTSPTQQPPQTRSHTSQLQQQQQLQMQREQQLQQQQQQQQQKQQSQQPANLQKVPGSVTMKTKRKSENEDFQTELIELLLKSYFKIVRKNVKDKVPKSIMYFLVNSSKEQIQNELVQELYKEDKFNILLEESDDVAQRREQHEQTIKILSTAQRILNEIIDYRI